nr:hypothetical protein Itr_chr08CG01610 [Ipomoea trifida]
MIGADPYSIPALNRDQLMPAIFPVISLVAVNPFPGVCKAEKEGKSSGLENRLNSRIKTARKAPNRSGGLNYERIVDFSADLSGRERGKNRNYGGDGAELEERELLSSIPDYLVLNLPERLELNLGAGGAQPSDQVLGAAVMMRRR